jgi:hypothetical protein
MVFKQLTIFANYHLGNHCVLTKRNQSKRAQLPIQHPVVSDWALKDGKAK